MRAPRVSICQIDQRQIEYTALSPYRSHSRNQYPPEFKNWIFFFHLFLDEIRFAQYQWCNSLRLQSIAKPSSHSKQLNNRIRIAFRSFRCMRSGNRIDGLDVPWASECGTPFVWEIFTFPTHLRLDAGRIISHLGTSLCRLQWCVCVSARSVLCTLLTIQFVVPSSSHNTRNHNTICVFFCTMNLVCVCVWAICIAQCKRNAPHIAYEF